MILSYATQKIAEETRKSIDKLNDYANHILKEFSGADRENLANLATMMDDFYQAKASLEKTVEEFNGEVTILKHEYLNEIENINAEFKRNLESVANDYFANDYTKNVIAKEIADYTNEHSGNFITMEVLQENILNESGNATDKAISQNFVTNAISVNDLILENGSIRAADGKPLESNSMVRTKDYVYGNFIVYVKSPYYIRSIVYFNADTLKYDSFVLIDNATASIGKDGCVAKINITLDLETAITFEDVKNNFALEKLDGAIEKLNSVDHITLKDNIILEQGSINALNGKYNDNNAYVRTVNFITKNVVLTVSNPFYIRTVVYYNADTLKYDSYVIVDDHVASIGKDGCVAKVCITLDQETPFTVADIKKITDLEFLLSKIEQPLAGKTIFNFGDSIAEGGANNDVSYAHIIANENNMNIRSFAVGGMTMANTKNNSVFVSVQNAITNHSDKNADFILINGGCNDINENVAIGDIIEGYNVDECDTTTFTGALETVFFNLRSTWTFANIIYILVHKMTSRDNLLQKQFHDRTIEICEKWGVPYVDIYNHGQITSHIPALASSCFNSSETSPTGYDRTHPNDIGYRKFYCPPIKYKMMELLS